MRMTKNATAIAALLLLLLVSLFTMPTTVRADDYSRRLYLIQRADPFGRDVVQFSATTGTNNVTLGDFDFYTYDRIQFTGVLPAANTANVYCVNAEGYLTNLVATVVISGGTGCVTNNLPYIFRGTGGDTVRTIGITNGTAVFYRTKRGGLSK